MKKALILFFFMSSTLNTLAQYFTIPDSAFASQLNYYFPQCMNGNQLDTTCPAALTENVMQLGGAGIADLTGIEYFPALQLLDCFNNQLTTLPELPGSLTFLDCAANQLSSLPELPESLVYLFCYFNQLTSLPALPQSLNTLICSDNQIACFPVLPESLESIGLDNNSFLCLPNYVAAMQPNLLSYPLCVLAAIEDNPFGCIGAAGIYGSIYLDENFNCAYDDLEVGLSNLSLQLIDDQESIIAATMAYTNSGYHFSVDTGNFTVVLNLEDKPFELTCSSPGAEQYVSVTDSIPTANGVDFGVECMSGFDLGCNGLIVGGWVFPDQQHTLNVLAGDVSTWYGLQCSEGVSGSVSITIDGPVTFVEPANGALNPTVSDDIHLTYAIEDFGSVDFEDSFAIILETDTVAEIGDLVCVEILVNPIEDDLFPENNTYSHCYEVVNSYDPNIKQVWPQNVEPGYDGYFNYTVYFQNTGTAPAFNIRVADTLDTNLDLGTFEVTAYSHECLTYMQGNVATFRFNNIMLPDSTSDFDGSIGYVQYRIKPIADLPVGTVIENTAHIFFDFNEAIVTNTTQNEFVIDTSIDHLPKQIATVFPNPGTGQFNVLLREVNTGITTQLEVYNLSGQRVLQQQVNVNRVVLDLTDYPSGMYLLHVQNENGSEAVKLMKH